MSRLKGVLFGGDQRATNFHREMNDLFQTAWRILNVVHVSVGNRLMAVVPLHGALQMRET